MKKRSKHPFGIPPFKAPESWANKSKEFEVRQSGYLMGIKVQTLNETFVVPIIDATKTHSQRLAAEEQIKQNNISGGSKYLRPSYSVMGYCYQNSAKK